MEVENEDSDKNLSEVEDLDQDEEQAEERINELEKIIAENPFHYDSHLQLIKECKNIADLDRLRSARKRMSNAFPLTPELWLDWLKDETELASTLDEKKKLVEIFEKAVTDYLSIELWLEYMQFNIRIQNERTDECMDQVRNIFERALTAGCLHVLKGSLLWDAYIEFEMYIASMLADKVETEKGQNEYAAQLQRIVKLFKRQLSCPLMGMEETKKRFDAWLTEIPDTVTVVSVADVNSVYKTALAKLNAVQLYEDKLLLESEDKLSIYKSYIEHERSKQGSPSRVLCLYERAVSDGDLCLQPSLWADYIDYFDTLSRSPAVIDLVHRSLRNCPWSFDLHQLHMRLLEKYEKPNIAVTAAMEEALNAGFQSATDFKNLWMTYLEYLRRRYDTPDLDKKVEEDRLEELREAFVRALEHVGKLDGADPECEIVQYWARIEAIYCKNMEKSRSLWSDIMKREEHNSASMWMEYIHLERTFGDSKHLRKLFVRAMTYTRDWPEVIKQAWINYERDEGTFESYESCVKKCGERMKEVLAARARDAVGTVPGETMGRGGREQGNRRMRRAGLGFVGEEEERKKPVTGYKRKNEAKIDVDVSPAKKEKVEEKSNRTEDIVQRLLKEAHKDSGSSHGVSVFHDSSKDNRTVFVSNLSFDTEEQTIKDTFSNCGAITDLRLVKDFKGRSKGYCYVEFQDQKEAAEALKKDREKIDSRPMFVSKCDPDRQTRGPGFKFSSSLEKNKLFVRGLPFTTTEQDLREMFGQYGSIKDVRLVTYRNGHSKGLAYVDFEDEVSAAQAIIKIDGTKLGDNEVKVAISNPPMRKTETTAEISSLGGGPKETGPRGRSRTQVSFLPRSVQLQQNPADSIANLSIASPKPQNNSTSNVAGDQKTAMSNSQFRELLFNKK